MAQALFISEQFIKENTPIDGNVDDKYITTSISDAQKMHIRPITGTALYNEISTQIVNGSVSVLNQTLLNEYLQDALKYWVLYEGLDIFQYKITNKAVVTKKSDDSSPVDTVDIVRLKDSFKDKAEFFSQLATKYLLANVILYPLFTNAGVTLDTIQPNYNNYTTGWNLDDMKSNYNLPVSPKKINENNG